MEARERLAKLLGGDVDGRYGRNPEALRIARDLYSEMAYRVLSALHLSDAAALALMDGEGVVAPKKASPPMHLAGEVVDPGIGGCPPTVGNVYAAMLAASPYKENPDDR